MMYGKVLERIKNITAVLFDKRQTCSLAIILCLLVYGCGSSNENDNEVVVTLPLTINEIESNIRDRLNSYSTDEDFTFLIKSQKGRVFTHNTGSSNEFISYESASTSKLVTAVIILTLVEEGILSLSDNPQQYITSWPQSSNLAAITLHDLLNFTSGLKNAPFCLNRPFYDFEACVDDIVSQNSESMPTGEIFYYSSTHLQVAGLMAVKAAGYTSWDELFNAFQADTSLFLNSSYDLPSISNPRLAGGMHWTANDYLEFLEAITEHSLISSNTFDLLKTDQIAAASIEYSPALNELNEDWHYSYGTWVECASNIYNCEQVTRVSSPGAYGAYPFIDIEYGYYGIIARKGDLGSTKEGVELFKSVEDLIEEWALK